MSKHTHAKRNAANDPNHFEGLESRAMMSGTPAATDSALAYDAKGNLHVAYYDDAAHNLKYTVQSAASGSWSSPVVVDKGSKDVGQQVSLALDKNGLPAIAYRDVANKDLKYAHFDGKKWTVSSVDSKNNTGINPSLAFDKANHALISYYRPTAKDLQLATLNGKTWTFSTISSGAAAGQFSSIAINPATGKPSVAFEGSDGKVRYVDQSGKGFTKPVVIDSIAKSGSDLSLSFGTDKKAAFSYYDPNTGDIKLAVKSGKGFTVDTVATVDPGQDPGAKVIIDKATGKPQVVYYDAANDGVYVATKDGDVTLVGAGGSAGTTVVVDPKSGKLLFTEVSDGGTPDVHDTRVIPNAPTDVDAEAVSATRVDVSWSDNSDNEAGFLIERSSDGGATITVLATTAANATSYSDTTAVEGTTYLYRVTAVGPTGINTPADDVAEVTTFPAGPTHVVATGLSATSVNVTWSDNSASEDGYSVDRSSDGGATYASLADLPAGTTSYQDDAAAEGLTYTYRVTANNDAGDSVGGTASVTTLVAAPAALTATSTSASQVNLAWTDASAHETGFVVQRSADGVDWSTIGTLGANATAFVDSTVAAGGQYTYRVKATGAAGPTAYATSAATRVIAAAPVITATTVSITRVDLAWPAVPSATSYVIERSTDGGDTFDFLASFEAAGNSNGAADSGAAASPDVVGYSDTSALESSTYQYRVRAVNDAGESANSNAPTATTFLAAPSDLDAAAASATQINLTWTDNSNGETGFVIERSGDGGDTFTTIHTAGPNATSYNDATAAEGAHYVYRIHGVKNANSSDLTQTAAATTPMVAPTGLTATASSLTQIDLTWADNSSAETGYEIYRSTDGGTTYTLLHTTAAGATSYSDTTAAEAHTYSYKVRAVNAIVQSAYATPQSVTTKPAAPASLTGTVVSATRVDLTWADNSNGETGYRVERNAAGAGFVALPGSLPAGTTSFSDTTATEGVSYAYRVFAVNAAGDSAASNSVTAVTLPAAPSGLTATVTGATSVHLTWTDNSAHESGFIVERSPAGGGSFAAVSTLLAADAASFDDTTASAGTTYVYRVLSVNSAAATAASNTQSVLTLPAAATGVAATATSATSLDVTWAAVTGASSYLVERSADAGSTWTTVGTPTTNGVTDSGATEGGTFVYRVTSHNATGDGAVSNNSTGVTTIPAAPTGLVATPISATEIDLAFSDHSAHETGFVIERSDDAGATWTTIRTNAANATSWADTNAITGGHTYSYRVRATGSAGDTATVASNAALTVPDAVSNLAASMVSASANHVTWSDLAGETGYTLERSADAGSTWTTVSSVIAADTISFDDTGLAEGVTYTYRLTAANTTGAGVAGNLPTATTLVAAPTATTATPVSASQIDVSWTDHSSHETGFVIERSDDGGTTWSTVHTNVANAVTWSDTTGITGGHTYSYRVRATGAAGDTATVASNAALTVPAALTDVAASTVSASSNHLTWTDTAGESGYLVEHSADGGTTWSTVATLPADSASANDTGLAEGVTYTYRVTPANVTGAATVSNLPTATTLPAAAAITAATPVSASRVDLTWTDNSTHETGYRVERSDDNGVTWNSLDNTLAAGTTTFSDLTTSAATSYKYRVIAKGTAGDSAASNVSTALTVPAAPGSAGAIASADTHVSLSWSSVTGATGYSIERSDDGGTTWNAPVTVGNVLTYADASAAEATFYVYRVSATNATGAGVASPTATVTTLPAAATNLTKTVVSATRVDLAWADNSNGETGYLVERSANGGTNYTPLIVLSPNVTAYSDAAAAEGTAYVYRVKPVDITGTGAGVTVNATTIPATPTSLLAAPVSATRMDLTWLDNSAHETSYVIERSDDGGTTWATAHTSAAGSTSWSDLTVTGGITYKYRLHATGAGGNSADSNVQTALTVPSTVTDLALSVVSDTQINVTWTDAAGETGYTLERSNDGGSTWTTAASPAANATSFNDTALPEGVTYTYRLTSANGTGPSAASNLPAATTLPTAPDTLALTPVSATRIDLTWADHSAHETAFSIDRSTDGGTTWTHVTDAAANATSYSDTGVVAGTNYTYRVRAKQSSAYSADSNTPAALTIPAAPTTVAATVVDDTHVSLTWDAMHGADSYLVEVYDGVIWSTVGTPTTNSITDSAATEASAYTYRVTAINTTGSSATGTSNAVLTLAAPITDLAATPVNAGQINLTWSDPSNGESGFRIERSPDGTTGWTGIHTTAPNAVSWSDTTVSAGTTYYYRIYALDATADSAVSNVVHKLTHPGQVTGLTATPLTDTAVTLQWDLVTSATSFLVEYSDDAGSSWHTVGSTAGTVLGHSNATEATAYLYRVTASNATGDGVASATQAATTYAALPTGVTATPTTATNVNLSWTDHSAGETGFVIERADDGGDFGIVHTNAANATTWSDATVLGGHTYQYRVSVTDSTGASPAVTGSAVLTIPGAVAGFTPTTVSATAIDWTWSAVHGATGYQIDVSTNAGSTWSSVTTINDGDTLVFHNTGLTEGTHYLYQISATDTTGGSVAASATGTTLAAAASTLTATPTSNTNVDLAWHDNSSGETGYKVQRSDDNGETWTTVHTTAANATSWSDTVTGGTSYQYQILATNAGGDSPASNAVTALTFPDQLTGLNASCPSATEMDFTWSAVTGADSYTIQISTNGGSTWNDVDTTTDTHYAVTGLTEGTNYDFQVFATDATGDGDFSADASVTTIPATPTDLTATPTSATHVDLAWTANSAHDNGYDVYRSTDNGDHWTNIHTTTAGAASYSDNAAPEDAALKYKVVATGDGGDSDDSNLADATTPIAAPTSLTATATGPSTVTLNWTDNSSVETGYKIERSTNGTDWTPVVTTAAGVQTFGDTGLTEDVTYTYRVTATDGAVDSTHSNTPTAKTALTAPTSTAAVSTTATQVDLTWADNSLAEDGYKVERSDDNGSTWTVIHTTAAGATSYSDATAAEGTSYKYRVRAANAGNFSAYDSVVTLTTLPAAPTSLSGSPFSTTRIDLTWADNSAHESGYVIERSTDHGDTWHDYQSVAANSTSYHDTGLTEGTDYQYRVRATSGVTHDSLDSDATPTIATLPNAPTTLTATVAGANEVDLAWADNSNGETSYAIERSTNNGVSFTTLASVDPGTTSYPDTTAAEATAYVYRVRAVRNASHSDWSNSSTQVTTLPAAADTLVVTTPTNTRAVLTWADNSAGETGFKIQRSTNGGDTWSTINTLLANATTYSDNTVSEGGSYAYRVVAYNTTGDALPSNTATANMAPANPTGLTATPANPHQVNLTWIDHSATEAGFKVERSTNGGSTWTQIDTTASNVTTYHDTTVAEGATYQYRVRAYSDGGNSGYTATVSALTPLVAPTGLTATTVSSTRVNLVWVDNSSAESQYKVERSADNGGSWSTIATVAANSTSYADTTATEGHAYQYQVKAARTGNASAYTTVALATTLPASPSALIATVASDTQVNLAWADNSSGETGFVVERSPDNGTTWAQVGTTLAANATSYNDTTASEGAAYTYRVKAINAGGPSAYATSSSVTTLPAAPTVLAASSPFGDTVLLTWTDNSAHETGYKIERSDNAGSTWTQIDTAAADATSYSDFTVDEGATYQYRVRANLSAANSAYSNTQTVTTVPLMPSDLASTVVSATRVDLTWTDNSDGETSYKIERSDDGGLTFTEINSIAANSTTYSDTTVTEGLFYQYRIRAYNAGGYSGYSDSVEALTLPAAPSDLAVTGTYPDEIDLAWTDNSVGEDGFILERQTDGGTWDALDPLGPDVHSYADTDVTTGHTYAYRVRAYNTSGVSANSNTDSATI